MTKSSNQVEGNIDKTLQTSQENIPLSLQWHDAHRQAKSAFLWIASTTTIWQGISWIVTLWTARILVPSDYGLIALAETILPYLGLIAALNLPTWILQTRHFSQDDEKALFTLTALLGVVLSGCGFILAPVVASFYNNPAVVLPFQMLALVPCMRGFASVPEALLRRELHFKPIAIMDVCVGISRAGLQLGLAYLGAGYWALVAGVLYKEVVCAVWLIGARGLPRGLRWDTPCFVQALGYGVAATGATMLWIVYSSVDEVIIGKFFGQDMLGFYTMAFFLSDLPSSKLSGIVKPILIPYLSRFKDHPREFRRVFLKIVKVVAVALTPLLIGLGLVASRAVPLALGAHWTPMVLPLQVLCIVGILRALMDYIPSVLLALGYPRRELFYNAFGLVLMGPAFYILARFLGMWGIYATWLCGFPITVGVALFILQKTTGISPAEYLQNLRAPLSGIVGMAGATFLAGRLLALFSSDVWILLIQIVFGATIYGAVLWFCFRDESREILQTLRELRTEH